MADWGIDFSPIASLPKIARDTRLQANRERTLADLGRMGGDIDYNAAAQQLLAAGDTQGAMTLASLGNNQRDFAFRQQEATRAQGNADRSFGLQQQTAQEAARGYDYREIDDGTGGKTLVRIHKETGKIDKPAIAGQDTTPQNPFTTGKMNESQSKDALYTSRMLSSEKILRGTEAQGADYVERRKQYVSDKTGYNVNSTEYQKFDQARRDFINATLRRESGAVISPDEFDNANKQYFPTPGNPPEVIEQKRKNRAEAIRGIGAGAGPGYRPDHVFAADGSIVANPSPQRNAPAQAVATPAPASAPTPKTPSGITKEMATAARADQAATLVDARKAIADGKDRAAVVRRLQQFGIDPAGL